MKILNFFYENPPENKDIFTRKITLDNKNTLIKGAKKSAPKRHAFASSRASGDNGFAGFARR